MTAAAHDTAAESGVFVCCLTGGPCGGKSTVQNMLSDVFENLGYKVYRVPETASILLSCGATFSEMCPAQQAEFQNNLLMTMLRIEQVFFDLAHTNWTLHGQKTVVICDRGAMDPSAYTAPDEWARILAACDLREVNIRDNRYDLVVHLVTAADGAEPFYHTKNNSTRTEGLELARHLDALVKQAWVGHPYYRVIDNSTNFEQKCNRVVAAVLDRMGLDDKRWGAGIRKYKFLVSGADACFFGSGASGDNDNHGNNNGATAEFPVPYRDFSVEHCYLVSSTADAQTRIRRRYDRSGTCHYNITIRRPPRDGQKVEERRSLGAREYQALREQAADPSREVIVKQRRCFLWRNHYFQLDRFTSPCPGLVLMEAYLSAPAQPGDEALPPFIRVEREVTHDPAFSMFHLAAKQGDGPLSPRAASIPISQPPHDDQPLA